MDYPSEGLAMCTDRSRLYADPEGVFLHDAVLRACNQHAQRAALVDTSIEPPLRLTYAEYGERVEAVAKGLVASGVKQGEVIAIYLANGWEFAVTYHAATLAGAIPTLLNPSYREREVRFQLEDSGAAILVTDGPLIAALNLGGLPALRKVYCIRQTVPGSIPFGQLLSATSALLSGPTADANATLAALPYSSGTTGLPKGVMLSHSNLVTNAYQRIPPGERLALDQDDVTLCFLPLYHIYGLNVILNPTLMTGGSVVLMPRFDMEKACSLLTSESVTFLPMVPPVVNALCHAAEQGLFPANHRVRYGKSGAAPLAPDLPRRFERLTGIQTVQGYGMTEASPVTHMGFLEPALYRPDSIGRAVAKTECRIVDEADNDVPPGEPGELLMRGPQFMSGYWKNPEATADVLKEGWYRSGDVATRDNDGFYQIVDRRKELIKYKGFPIAPAEVEAVLLEHASVRDCGVIGKTDDAAGEIPVAFVVLRDNVAQDTALMTELCGFVAERLTSYKQPREVRFVSAIPRNPSGKILRKDLRTQI
ncbi:MAG TPA: AMP-binding protein [Terriglobales bacterium]|nr:AMP-binding protein [Terriglobales bacterium]